ncbi:MAG: hypothetical protein ACR2KP_10940 [Egibacteraceae bacterium]
MTSPGACDPRCRCSAVDSTSPARSASIVRYTDRLGGEAADALVARLEALLTDAYRDGDHARAHAAYAALIDHARGVGARKVARHLISEQGER